MLKHPVRRGVLICLTAMLLVQTAYSAPPGAWRWPFRLPVPSPLRIVERLRKPEARTQPVAEPQQVTLAGLAWHSDYSAAWKVAKQEKKMLLVLFTSAKENAQRQALLNLITKDAALAKKLESQFVLAAVSTDETIVEQGQRLRLLSHGSMQELHGFEGFSIVDLKSEGQPYYGYTVSAYPFMRGKYYNFRAADLPVILDLPAGTITQRTMIWAVRVHPERPSSTKGQVSTVLSSAAESHSTYQAQIGVQGHHQWDSRFHRILGKLGGRGAPVEVVAESWPNQTMIDSCVDCVASWRQSDGHWNAVRSYQNIYGYDIKRGNNGIWYGTGIFAR